MSEFLRKANPFAELMMLAGPGDTIPSLRIAVDLKVELFRHASKPWTMNAIHDVDALSIAAASAQEVLHQIGHLTSGRRWRRWT